MNEFTLSPKVYNFIKYLVLIVLPAVTTLYVVVATQWDWNNITNISVTLTAITAFLGTVVGISAKNYNNSDAKYFGEIEVEKTDEGTIIHKQIFNEDPKGSTLADKKDVMFKIVQK